jgi:hypothetical protein
MNELTCSIETDGVSFDVSASDSGAYVKLSWNVKEKKMKLNYIFKMKKEKKGKMCEGEGVFSNVYVFIIILLLVLVICALVWYCFFKKSHQYKRGKTRGHRQYAGNDGLDVDIQKHDAGNDGPNVDIQKHDEKYNGQQRNNEREEEIGMVSGDMDEEGVDIEVGPHKGFTPGETYEYDTQPRLEIKIGTRFGNKPKGDATSNTRHIRHNSLNSRNDLIQFRSIGDGAVSIQETNDSHKIIPEQAEISDRDMFREGNPREIRSIIKPVENPDDDDELAEWTSLIK